MPVPQPHIKLSPSESITSSNPSILESPERADGKKPDGVASTTVPALATQETRRMEAALGDAILRFLRIRKGPKGGEYDLDGVCNSRPLI